MKKTPHSPGPWAIVGLSFNEHEAHVIDSPTRTVCWTANTLGKTNKEFVSAEDQANACLIAAAPDLLAALKALLEDHKQKWGECQEVKNAQVAIDKAENPDTDNL